MSEFPPSARFPLLAAAVFGLTGVALGALGAHALEAKLEARGMVAVWETASLYHLAHALALLAVGIWLRISNGVGPAGAIWAARAWTVGILLFSGSLYLLALGGPRWLGPITPLGGVALMVGWAGIAFAAFGKR